MTGPSANQAHRPSSGRAATWPEELAGADPAGDAQVLDLYRTHAPMLAAQLTRKTGSRELAHEITHEVFVRLLRLPPALLARIERPGAYLRRIGLNLLRDWARSQAVAERSNSLIHPSLEQEVNPIALLESRDTLNRVELAIARLKPKTRQIFLAHRIEGLSYAEIAARTGLSIKGVEKQMSKAIAKIDRLLDRG